MKSGKARTVVLLAGLIAGVVLLTMAAALVLLHLRTSALREDVSSVLAGGKYRTPVSVEGVEVIRQEVSCGYAVMEMFAAWSGSDPPEERVYREYGRVVTSTGQAFCDEMNKQFPTYRTEMRKYLKDTELLDVMYDTLSRGIPVPFEWAAKQGEEWTLHYSLLIGMDIQNNRITVANPYGYTEVLPVEDFLARTRFDAFEPLPFWLRLGFAFGLFEKNTVFVVQ